MSSTQLFASIETCLPYLGLRIQREANSRPLSVSEYIGRPRQNQEKMAGANCRLLLRQTES
jgi:hypothetical protein